MDAAGAVDPGGRARRAAAQDRHAGGNERHSLSAANRLPVALDPGSTSTKGRITALTERQDDCKFQRDGIWETIWAELHMALREQLGREASPSAAVIDSQSLKSAEKGVARMAQWVTTPPRK